MTIQDRFTQLTQDLQNDPDVLAFWLCGSRGKGLSTERSDYDCMMIVNDDVGAEYKLKYETFGRPDIEIVGVFTLDEFKTYADWSNPVAWDRYNFAHLRPLFDKTGEVQPLIDEKATIPADKVNGFIADSLGGYINQVYRSLKCLRDGNVLAARLETAESIYILLDAFFALHGKVKPYYKYLEWELQNYPLQKLPWSAGEFTTKLTTLLDTADPTTQQEMLITLEEVFRTEGYGHCFDEWKEKLTWMKTVQIH